MNTLRLPRLTLVQALKGSPTRAAPREFMKTDLLASLIGVLCTGHGAPGNRCGVLTSSRRAAPRSLMNTSVLAVRIVKPLQCGTPGSVLLAAAGTFSPHQFIKTLAPGMYFIMLCISVWRRWYFWHELYHMIDVLGYVLESLIFLYLTIDHDHESVCQISQSGFFCLPRLCQSWPVCNCCAHLREVQWP